MKLSRVLFRFLVVYLVLHLLMVGLFVLVLTRATRTKLLDNTRREMRSLASMLREHVRALPGGLQDESLVPYLLQLGSQTNFRFTLIDESGMVLADSSKGTSDIGPHADRAEIVAARVSEEGFSERFSNTMSYPMVYLAIPYRVDSRETADLPKRSEQENAESAPLAGFVRVAMPLKPINKTMTDLQTSILLFAIIASALTAFLMMIVSSRAMEPLNRFAEAARQIGAGSLAQPVPLSTSDDEWGRLSDAFSQMQDRLVNRENRLIENKQRVEAVFRSMIEGVLSTSADGTVRNANDAACEMLSLDRAELVGRKLLDVIRFPEFQKAVERTLDNRSFSEIEFEVFDDPRRIVKARVSPLSTEPALGVAIVLHDVTEIRSLENMRRDFVANVSHELKTPLASIKAYAETLRMGALKNDPDRAVGFVQQIEDQAEVLSLLIHDLIELARIESVKETVDIVPLKLNDVCQTCISRFQSQANKREIDLQFESVDGDTIGLAELEGIQTVVNNLISNAIRYTSQGGRVVVRTRYEEVSAIIEVADSGIGIAPEQQARVFERFYRVDKARSRDMGGTGLGLSIVKHLTQSFGGSVHLSSQIGKGSTFQVRIARA